MMRLRKMVLTLVCLSMLLAAFHQPSPASAAATGDWSVRVFETYDLSRPYGISMASDGTDHPCIAYNDEHASGLVCARWTGSTWSRAVVDSSFYQLGRTSVAVDPEGHPRVAYTVGVDTPTGSSYQLRLATYTGTSWTTLTVADMGNAYYANPVSIALGGSDLPRIAYYDPTAPGIMYAAFNGVKWAVSKVFETSQAGARIALDPSGKPYVCCWDYPGCRLLLFTLDGGTWRSEVVDTVEYAGFSLSMAVDSDGHPHIAYGPATPSQLRYATWTGSSWDRAVVDEGPYAGEGASIALDAWDRPHISYFDHRSSQIGYAMWKGGQWVKEAVSDAVSADYGTWIGLNSTGSPSVCYENWTGRTIYMAMHLPNNLPTTPARPTGPALGLPGASYGYSTHATDADNDTIEYLLDWGDGTTTRSKALSSGETVTLPHRWSRSGSFPVRAMAVDEYGGRSPWSQQKTVLIDNQPNVPVVPRGPSAGAVGVTLTFTTSAVDPDGDDVKYVFELVTAVGPPPALRTLESATVASGGEGNVSHQWDVPGNYSVRAKSVDELGVESPWSAAWEFVVSTPPAAPGRPTGPSKCLQGAEASFGASATDADDDRVRYEFDWNASGTGTTTLTDLFAPGTAATATHSWARWGTYPVKVRALDEHGIASGWSDTLEVAVNAPPGAPVAPTAPAKAEAGKAVGLTASAVDPDGDMVKLVFDWGEGGNATAETGFFPSGTPTNLSHTWKKAGTYKVRVKAVDADGSASDWSAPVDVVVKAKGKGTPGPSAAAAMAALAAAATVAAAASRNKTRGRR